MEEFSTTKLEISKATQLTLFINGNLRNLIKSFSPLNLLQQYDKTLSLYIRLNPALFHFIKTLYTLENISYLLRFDMFKAHNLLFAQKRSLRKTANLLCIEMHPALSI